MNIEKLKEEFEHLEYLHRLENKNPEAQYDGILVTNCIENVWSSIKSDFNLTQHQLNGFVKYPAKAAKERRSKYNTDKFFQWAVEEIDRRSRDQIESVIDQLVEDDSIKEKPSEEDVKQVLQSIKVPEGREWGYCAEASVTLWDRMGQPKDFRPYSVMLGGDEEHVLLYNKRTRELIDPTGMQFDQPIFQDRDDSGYSSFVRMTDAEIQYAREERDARLSKKTP